MAYVTVDLDQFDDEDIRDEYEARGLGTQPTTLERMEQLQAIYVHMRMGRKDQAYDLMQEYVLDTLGRVI